MGWVRDFRQACVCVCVCVEKTLLSGVGQRLQTSVCVCVCKTLLSQWPGWVRDLRQTALLFFWPSISGGGAWPASFREYYFDPVVMSFDRPTCAYTTFGQYRHVQHVSLCSYVFVYVLSLIHISEPTRRS